MKKSISITIDENNITKLNEQSEAKGQSVSRCLNQILEDFLASVAKEQTITGQDSKDLFSLIPKGQRTPIVLPKISKKKKRTIHVSLECETVERIRELAKRDYRPVSSAINLILRNKL